MDLLNVHLDVVPVAVVSVVLTVAVLAVSYVGCSAVQIGAKLVAKTVRALRGWAFGYGHCPMGTGNGQHFWCEQDRYGYWWWWSPTEGWSEGWRRC